ncbi:MAG TPA: TRAP transporter small permease subunit [Steroidobacteraceae bacterium]|jgi:TRAP-type C4-dicarboxylate transport system permease small subunit|nr:TRAP transporter small permease subunit [Steroidobacteraceae bacterium]
MMASRGPLFWTGAAALLIVTGVDAAAVLGRHIGPPFPGSLELVQAAILLASTAGLVAATAVNRHASARLVLDRVPAVMRGWMLRLNALMSVLFFLLLAAGQLWITSDLWHAHEDSDVLHIPFAPLRVLCVVGVLLAALIVSRRMIRPDQS